MFLDISCLLATVVCHEVALVTPSQFASVVKSFLGKKKHRQLPRGSSQVDSAIPASKRGGFAEQEAGEIMPAGPFYILHTRILLWLSPSKI